MADGSFGYRYPSQCEDGEGVIGCDQGAFLLALRAEISGISWPLHPGQIPDKMTVLDLLEFCHRSVGKPVTIQYHSFWHHNHLSFNRDEGESLFRNDVNLIFARNQLVYEMGPGGRIIRLAPEILNLPVRLCFQL